MQRMQNVSFEGIGALVPGPSEILDAWAEYGGVRVSQVPPGEKFDILVRYRATNTAGGNWKATVTAKGNGIQNYEDSSWFGTEKSETVKLDKMGDNFMPSHDLAVRLKLWLHDDVSEDYPPINEW